MKQRDGVRGADGQGADAGEEEQPTSRQPRRTTMRDVAKEAGVSVQTVSNVVHGRSQHMTSQTEAHVLEIIERLHFRPNSVARGLRSARTQTLAFVVLDPSARFLADPMTDLFLSGLGDELRDRSHGLLIRSSGPDMDLDSLIEPITDGRVDGAVLFLSGTSTQRRAYVEELASRLSLPCLLLQEHGVDDLLPAVCADDRSGSREICRYLISLGHTQIGFITASRGWSAIDERIAGYQEAHEEAGIDCHPALMLRAGDFKPVDAAAAAGDLLDRHPRPTAVMCGNDLIALGVMKAARDRGLSIPRDLGVAGFDDFDFAAAVDPPLATVRIPGYEMGRYAAAAIIDAFEGSGTPVGRSYETEVFLRGSV